MPDLDAIRHALESLSARSQTAAAHQRLVEALADKTSPGAMLLPVLGRGTLAVLDSRGAEQTLLGTWSEAIPELRRSKDYDASSWWRAAEPLRDARLLFFDAARSRLWFCTPFEAETNARLWVVDHHEARELGPLGERLVEDLESLARLPIEHLSWNVPEPSDLARLPSFDKLRSLSLGSDSLDGDGVAPILELRDLLAVSLRGQITQDAIDALAAKPGLRSLTVNGRELLLAIEDAPFENHWQGKPIAAKRGMAGIIHGRALLPSRRGPRMNAERLRFLRARAADRGLEALVVGGFMDGLVDENLRHQPLVVGTVVGSTGRSSQVDRDAFERARDQVSRVPERFWEELAAASEHFELERQPNEPWLWVTGRLEDRGGRAAVYETPDGNLEVRTGDTPGRVSPSPGTLRCTSWKD